MNATELSEYGAFGLILSAIEWDDVNRLSALIARGDAQLAKRCDPEGMTPLMNAARLGSLNCIKLLLPLSEVDAADCYGMTAMSWAVTSNKFESVKTLAGHCDLEARDKAGWTALMMAADARTFFLLLDHCEPRTHMGHATEALRLAASDGNLQMVEKLLPLADICSKDKTGSSARDYALGEEHSDVVNLIDTFIVNRERKVLLAAIEVSNEGISSERRESRRL